MTVLTTSVSTIEDDGLVIEEILYNYYYKTYFSQKGRKCGNLPTKRELYLSGKMPKTPSGFFGTFPYFLIKLHIYEE